MWSATWPEEVQELAQKFLQNPLQVTIGSDKLVANHAIKQVVLVIEGSEKFEKLKGLLRDITAEKCQNKTLVFTDTKKMADDISAELKSSGLVVQGHSNRPVFKIRYKSINGDELLTGRQPTYIIHVINQLLCC